MNIKVSFQKENSDWSQPHVYWKFFQWFEREYSKFNIQFEDTSNASNKDPGGPNSPHIITIRNLDTKKYIVVSYWDRCFDFVNPPWDHENLVEIITSMSIDKSKNIEKKVSPFSYLMWLKSGEMRAFIRHKEFVSKQNNDLFFRGLVYGFRKELMAIAKNNITEEKIDIDDYFKELSNNKICLSLNGAGEICHRDMEILAVGSVLFRPILEPCFHSPLIEGVHYIGFEKSNDPKTQWEIITRKFNQIKHNDDYLKFIANNGYKWYLENGTIENNVEILKKIVNPSVLL
jgi:hypothetical protein